MIKKFFVLICFISLTSLLFINSYILYTLTLNPQVRQHISEITYTKYTSNYTDAQIEQKKLEKVNKSTNQQNKLKTIGWIADWGMNNAVQEFERKAKQFDSISPFLFVPNEDGSLKNLQTRLTDRLRNIANQNNVEFIATIPLFDADVLSKILNNEESFKRHVDSIIEMLEKYNFDGIDLDYESTYLADKRLFFDFVEELSKKIKSIGKKFSFTVIAKWGDKIQYNSLPQTRRVQDYKRIADLVDEFRIMTYEFTPRMSRYAGPLSPINWVEKVIQYAINKGVPREKIVVGIHNYAFVWEGNNILKDLNLINFYQDIGILDQKGVLAFNYEDVEAILKNYINSTFNHPIWQESYSKFIFKNIERTMFFLSQENVNSRKQLAKEYGVKGVAYWRIGNSGNFVF